MTNPSLYELSKRKNRSQLLKSAFVRKGEVNVEAYDAFYGNAASTLSGFRRVYETVIAEVKRSFDAIDLDGEGVVPVTFYSSPFPHLLSDAVYSVPGRGVVSMNEL